jgi:hypothetical protein
MTRGRNVNHAYVVTEENQTALDVLSGAIARDWIDMPAVDRRSQLGHRRQRHSTGHTDGGELVGLDGSDPPAQRHPTTVRSSNRQVGLSLDR